MTSVWIFTDHDSSFDVDNIEVFASKTEAVNYVRQFYLDGEIDEKEYDALQTLTPEEAFAQIFNMEWDNDHDLYLRLFEKEIHRLTK
jgi:hypothetical protein